MMCQGEVPRESTYTTRLISTAVVSRVFRPGERTLALLLEPPAYSSAKGASQSDRAHLIA